MKQWIFLEFISCHQSDLDCYLVHYNIIVWFLFMYFPFRRFILVKLIFLRIWSWVTGWMSSSVIFFITFMTCIYETHNVIIAPLDRYFGVYINIPNINQKNKIPSCHQLLTSNKRLLNVIVEFWFYHLKGASQDYKNNPCSLLFNWPEFKNILTRCIDGRGESFL